MAVRLQQLTAPFHSEHHDLIQTSLYPLHLTARPHIRTTSCHTATDYLTTLSTHCALTHSTLILATLDDTVAGFAVYRSIYDTFNTHRLLLEELIVHPSQQRRGVGSVLLRYVQQVARDVGALYVTAEVPAGWADCQPLLAKQKFGVAALSFTTSSQPLQPRAMAPLMSPTSPTTPASPAPIAALTPSDLTTTVINIANFSSPHSTALLTALEPIYRQLLSLIHI